MNSQTIKSGSGNGSLTVSLVMSCSSLMMKIMSNRDKMVGKKSMLASPLVSSQRPNTELAAARTEQRELRVVVMPALAMEMVCCSMASWMATRSADLLDRGEEVETACLKMTICLPHLVKLVNADHTPICQHHSPTLHDKITRYRVSHHTGS